MTTKQVIEKIRAAIEAHKGDKAELYDALTDEANGWYDRHNELQAEAYDAACEDNDGTDPDIAGMTNQ